MRLPSRFSGLLKQRAFIESVAGHMPTDSVSQAHVELVLQAIEDMANVA